jgi:hypothetical protein
VSTLSSQEHKNRTSDINEAVATFISSSLQFIVWRSAGWFSAREFRDLMIQPYAPISQHSPSCPLYK